MSPGMIQARRAAREAALLILFAVDAARVQSPEEAISNLARPMREDDEILSAIFTEQKESKVDVEQALRVFRNKADNWAFVERLVKGVMNNRTAIDEMISRFSNNWKVSRMSQVDRNILRLAVYEMNFEEDNVPIRTTLNEAIEMAKRYGTEDSGKFVNGILDRIARELQKV